MLFVRGCIWTQAILCRNYLGAGTNKGGYPRCAVKSLLEPDDFIPGTVGNLCSVVGVDNDLVQNWNLSVTAVASGLLNQQTKRSDLEEQSQLGLGGGRDNVGENSLLLDNDLHNKRDVADN